MCWAYITAKSSSSLLKVNANPYLILLLGILPDVDLLLSNYGIAHRTLTHSVVFWSVLFIPLFIRYGKRSIPYFVAPLQHILLGDLVVSYTVPFWPLSSLNLGLDFPLLSVENIILETVSLSVFLIWVIKSGESKKLLAVKKSNLLSAVALAPLLGFLLFIYQSDLAMSLDVENSMQTRLESSAGWIINNDLFPFVAITHLILVLFLSVSLAQGVRALYRNTSGKRKLGGLVSQ